MLNTIIKDKVLLPPRILIHGTDGIGKTSLGASANKPIFICTEQGADEIGVDRFPLAKSVEDVQNAISVLYHSPDHDYKTVVLDTGDWYESLIHQDVCKEAGVNAIEKIGYGKGYNYALTIWQETLAALDVLRNKRGMVVVILVHTQVERFNNPETEAYDRYTPRLHKSSNALLREWADCVFFYGYKVLTRSEDAGFNKKKTKALSDAPRVIRTTEQPFYLAKNRYNMPPEIEIPIEGGWSLIMEAIRNGNQNQKEEENNGEVA